MQVIRHPQSDVSTGAYSPALRTGEWVFISGQGPLDMKTGQVVSEDIQSEVRRTLSNVEALLKQAGGSRRDVVKCTCYLADIADFDAFDTVYAEFFADQPRPARTTVGAALEGIKVEIDAVARIGGDCE